MSFRKTGMGIILGVIIILAALLYLGSTGLEEEMSDFGEEIVFDGEDTGEIIEEETTEEELPEEETTEEEVVEELGSFELSQKDCKCYPMGEAEDGRLDCRGVFGLVGCSEAGVPIKGHMLDREGNIKEQYFEVLGLA